MYTINKYQVTTSWVPRQIPDTHYYLVLCDTFRTIIPLVCAEINMILNLAQIII